MGKPGDQGNSTMPLSEDQVVAVSSKKPAKHDQSMWMGRVVGADEFAPAKPKRSRARTWVIVGVLGAGAAGGAIYEFRGASKDTGSAHAEAPASPPPPAPAPVPAPAAQPAVPAAADAAVAVATPDAAVQSAADAISSAAPVPKPGRFTAGTKKKKPTGTKKRH
jgi:hypothetical protein